MKYLSKFAFVFALFLAVGLTAAAQDSVRVGLMYQNLNVSNQNLPGVNGSVEVKLGGYGNWGLGAVGDVSYHRDTNRLLDRYQLLGGLQVSRSFGEERWSVFGRGMYGVTRFDQKNSKLQDFARATVSIGGGFDVRLTKKFAFRPLQCDVQYIDERQARYTRLATGVVFTP